MVCVVCACIYADVSVCVWCIHACMHAALSVHVYVWWPEEDVRYLLFHTLPCSLETGSLTKLDMRLAAREPQWPDPPVSAPPRSTEVTGKYCHTQLFFFFKFLHEF